MTSSGPRCDADCNLAEIAKSKLVGIIVDQPLEINADRFGRTLAYMRVSGADVGECSSARAH